MYRNASILVFCIVILGYINITIFKNTINGFEQARAEELVPSSIATASVGDAPSVDTIDESILIEPPKTENEEKVATTTASTVKKPKTTIKSNITAEEYLVGNLDTGEVYLSSNPNKVFPIASVSKLYTALVVHHLFDLDKKITITGEMLNAYGNAGNLQVDEKFTPDELMHVLLMESSNDAADAYAYSFGYDSFIEQMNAFAQEIGMKSTSFKDASGLSLRNISNAKDLFILSQYLYKFEQDILDISKTKETTLGQSEDHASHHLLNINPFSRNPEFIGGKTGRTDEAKESMLSLLNKTVGDKVYPIAVIVLRSDFGERETNTEKLVNMFVEKMLK